MSWIRKWKSDKKAYSWKYIEKACRDIADQIKHSPPATIIGLSRGGLIPAVTLANMMGVREVYSIGIASYDSGYDSTENQQGSLRTYQKIPVNCPGMTNGETVLIVDDISDKGNTLQCVVNNVRDIFNKQVQTATIFTKHGTTFIPDYHHKQVTSDEWVVFPWENK